MHTLGFCANISVLYVQMSILATQYLVHNNSVCNKDLQNSICCIQVIIMQTQKLHGYLGIKKKSELKLNLT